MLQARAVGMEVACWGMLCELAGAMLGTGMVVTDAAGTMLPDIAGAAPEAAGARQESVVAMPQDDAGTARPPSPDSAPCAAQHSTSQRV